MKPPTETVNRAGPVCKDEPCPLASSYCRFVRSSGKVNRTDRAQSVKTGSNRVWLHFPQCKLSVDASSLATRHLLQIFFAIDLLLTIVKDCSYSTHQPSKHPSALSSFFALPPQRPNCCTRGASSTRSTRHQALLPSSYESPHSSPRPSGL